MAYIATAEKKLSLGGKKKKKVDALDFFDFDAIRLSMASPEQILSWSYGEVKKPETINYRTLKPERDGLFCERIFGPAHDYECACGKYRWVKFKGIVCDRCGVEVTEAKVRRERMGHIELAVPVTHIWFLKKTPSRIGIVLNMRTSDLERVVYYAMYIVLEDLIDADGRTVYKACDLLSEEEVRKAKAEFRSKLKVGIGAGAIHALLSRVKPKEEAANILEEIQTVTSEAERSRLIRRLRILQGFVESGNEPQWMVTTILPVIPPELRPLVPLEGGRFATSDLNDLYRRIINRNNRLKHIEALRAPEVMVFNEKRLLQEAVDALFENGARGRVVVGAGNRPLKSLSDILKGKQGRFRQNLLGKRVDYSGRSVIVVGPHLKLNQCGLPKEMALELFRPFIIRELMKSESLTLKAAKRMFEKARPEIWDILEFVTKNHPVMLNRAPTLHRLGIQAFEPVLIEGKSIQLHPLTCAAFNADFDGDQMAVHVPLSQEAQLEARVLMMASNNILSPASGRPIAVPSHDMVLGIHYLTKHKVGEIGEGMVFVDKSEVVAAYLNKKVDLHAKIKVRGINKIVEVEGKKTEAPKLAEWTDWTTVGRVLFNDVAPQELGYINAPQGKKELSQLVERCYKELGHYRTVILLDDLKRLGYHFATMAGLSISISDMHIPGIKKEVITQARKRVKEIEAQGKAGVITESERYNKIIDIWTHVTDKISDVMFDDMKKEEFDKFVAGKPRFNSVYLMADSGARGSRQQIRQLAGMRGLMAKPQKKLTGGVGEIIEQPIISNFREGLTVLEYFISTHGGRKGLADTALKTADAGYLTRRLVDVAHDLVIVEDDCGTINGVRLGDLSTGDEVIEPLEERLLGRVVLEDISAPFAEGKGKTTDKVIYKAGEIVTAPVAAKIKETGIEMVRARSVLTCESRQGVCAKCYGMNNATGRMVEIGEAVGIIAAQSIGEPGTQLTLRTFHIGGTASRVAKRSQVVSLKSGTVEFKNVRTIKNREGQIVVVSRTGMLLISEKGIGAAEEYKILYGARLKVLNGAKVVPGQLLAEWDPYTMPIVAEHEGEVRLLDVREGVTLHEERNKITGIIERKIIEQETRRTEKTEGGAGKRLNPRVVIEKGGKDVTHYPLPTDTILLVESGQPMRPGDIVAKIPQEVTKSKDITGGLPRVSELFEARRPKTSAIISEIEGAVSLGIGAKGLVQVSVRNEETDLVREYLIPQGKHLVVYEGDRVGVGEAITDGAINPHDVLHVKGIKEVQEFLVNAIQEVYRLQGVSISDRHIECIVRQMLENVKIVNSGDTSFLKGEIINRFAFADSNRAIKVKDGREAQAEPVLLGITKASLASNSFVSAASFQETTRVLTEAATTSKIDYLKGLKENVIIGHMIPAGTGLLARARILEMAAAAAGKG
ncbi:MAG: DNA-directed RNA polymerase subunit beta' [Elusimicrobia bacterium RIFCSPHIGHO2_02_FULL_57_9]|nr:MAG: DNA-directed RNA polymerase subunit beta' [Elusimicrobia bacterium RIFCSPHIGHO2_02_FULL_57_9]